MEKPLKEYQDKSVRILMVGKYNPTQINFNEALNANPQPLAM